MTEPSDGIAEEFERQLQLALATAAVAARRVVAAREQSMQQAQRDSEHAARAAQAQIDAQRQLAAARLQPVLDSAWWDTADPRDIAAMWKEANSWRDPQRTPATSTIFDQTADRIRDEVRDRSGLDPSQRVALATVQELEHEHQQPLVQTTAEHTSTPQDASRALDHPQRSEQLRARLSALGVPEPAIDPRTLADLGHALKAEHAVRTPVTTTPDPTATAARRAGRQLHRQR